MCLEGERDVLGLWAGQGGKAATFWMSVLTDLGNRGDALGGTIHPAVRRPPRSNRTSLYVAYARIVNDNGATFHVGNATETGTGNKAFNLGCVHNF